MVHTRDVEREGLELKYEMNLLLPPRSESLPRQLVLYIYFNAKSKSVKHICTSERVRLGRLMIRLSCMI